MATNKRTQQVSEAELRKIAKLFIEKNLDPRRMAEEYRTNSIDKGRQFVAIPNEEIQRAGLTESTFNELFGTYNVSSKTQELILSIPYQFSPALIRDDQEKFQHGCDQIAQEMSKIAAGSICPEELKVDAAYIAPLPEQENPTNDTIQHNIGRLKHLLANNTFQAYLRDLRDPEINRIETETISGYKRERRETNASRAVEAAVQQLYEKIDTFQRHTDNNNPRTALINAISLLRSILESDRNRLDKDMHGLQHQEFPQNNLILCLKATIATMDKLTEQLNATAPIESALNEGLAKNRALQIATPTIHVSINGVHIIAPSTSYNFDIQP